MSANRLDWWIPQVGEREYSLVAEVLQSNFLNDGDVTTRFEGAVADLVGSKHAVAVTSGTTALFLALAAVGVGPGDEVVVPDVTFIATANAVTLTGARPVLADVEPQTLNLSPEALRRAITGRTRAVIPVHVSGRPADLAGIQAVADQHGLVVIEDAAEGLLSRWNGRCLGTIGKAGCLSFSPNKTITTGQGGMVLTQDDAVARRLRELKDQGRPLRGTGGADTHLSVGYNFKFTNLQAAVGLGQLMCLEERVENMKAIYRAYAERLQGLPGIRLFDFDTAGGESPQWVDALVEDRDGLDLYLKSHDVHCRRFWFPIHTQVPYRLPDESFPNSTRLSPRALWLPSCFTMSEQDVDRVCRHIREFLSGQQGGARSLCA